MFNERMTERCFLRSVDMGVLVDGEWRLYDAGAKLLYPGMLT